MPFSGLQVQAGESRVRHLRLKFIISGGAAGAGGGVSGGSGAHSAAGTEACCKRPGCGVGDLAPLARVCVSAGELPSVLLQIPMLLRLGAELGEARYRVAAETRKAQAGRLVGSPLSGCQVAWGEPNNCFTSRTG